MILKQYIKNSDAEFPYLVLISDPRAPPLVPQKYISNRTASVTFLSQTPPSSYGQTLYGSVLSKLSKPS